MGNDIETHASLSILYLSPSHNYATLVLTTLTNITYSLHTVIIFHYMTTIGHPTHFQSNRHLLLHLNNHNHYITPTTYDYQSTHYTITQKHKPQQLIHPFYLPCTQYESHYNPYSHYLISWTINQTLMTLLQDDHPTYS